MVILTCRVIRDRCKNEAEKFNFPIYLFNRIPMFIFNYFGSRNPFESSESGNIGHFKYIVPFMLINNISASLMAAFYSCGDQTYDVVLSLEEMFLKMWNIYRNPPQGFDLIDCFGNIFVFHLESRRPKKKIDGSTVVYRRTHSNREYFVPNCLMWRHIWRIRNEIRNNRYRIEDDYDMLLYREAVAGGIMLRGRRRV